MDTAELCIVSFFAAMNVEVVAASAAVELAAEDCEFCLFAPGRRFLLESAEKYSCVGGGDRAGEAEGGDEAEVLLSIADGRHCK